jgi:hypothetical protein
MTTFDGKGGLTQIDSVSITGARSSELCLRLQRGAACRASV